MKEKTMNEILSELQALLENDDLSAALKLNTTPFPSKNLFLKS